MQNIKKKYIRLEMQIMHGYLDGHYGALETIHKAES